MDADEEFARRLQAQEMGLPSVNDNTPLMNRNFNVQHTIQINETTNSRATVLAIMFVNIPQIVAGCAILSLHWKDPILACDESHELKWRVWATFAVVRMSIYSLVVVFMAYFRSWLEDRPRLNIQAQSFKNMVDGFGLIWFVVGNMWLFGDEDNSCRHPEKSPIYNLCLSMLIVNYVQICLPCIIAAIMIPVFCFCMPCLIRLMARVHGSRTVQGATEAVIDTIPIVTVGADGVLDGGTPDDMSCPICLNDMVAGDQVRLLPCKHIFHRQCVDEWLRVNASCPTCRKSALGSSAEMSNVNGNRSSTTPPTTTAPSNTINSTSNSNNSSNNSNSNSASSSNNSSNNNNNNNNNTRLSPSRRMNIATTTSNNNSNTAGNGSSSNSGSGSNITSPFHGLTFLGSNSNGYYNIRRNPNSMND